jgi:Ca2+-transporting ATPase
MGGGNFVNTPTIISTKHTLHKGLSSAEAAERLALSGPNELESSKPRALWAIAIETIREPMFLILLACSALYLLLGDLGEALLISAAILFVMLITFLQERRTERTLEALRDLSSPRALVLRDGTAKSIDAREIVQGDLVLINEGDRVSADGFVIASSALTVNESLLTGESVPVRKVEWNGEDAMGQAGGDETAFVYSGTMVVQGRGSLLVHRTGTATAMGRIGSSLAQSVRPPSTLQLETRRVVRMVATFSLTVSAVIALVWWLRDHDVLRGILMGLTFAMSTIPEEFPVVLTVFMALGAWRISRQKVLTRQMNAIESLGSATFLCVDKTGTLTENRMSVGALWTRSQQLEYVTHAEAAFSSDALHLVEAVALASDHAGADPMDLASVALARSMGCRFEKAMIHSYPLVRPLLAVGFAWAEKSGDAAKVFVKGAPEAVMSLCTQHDAKPCSDIADAVEQLAANGYRVLAVAESTQLSADAISQKSLPSFEFEFCGLVAFRDPVKLGVPEAVQQCHEAGVQVMMITGDYPATALSVAREIRLIDSLLSDSRRTDLQQVLTGAELSQLSDVQLSQRLKTTRVLARMVPEHKLRVVNALKSLGEVVAMTGDGVNDAPALKASHIGIAMGARGTDVAREAAALVLLNDDFISIVEAIRLGRRIYDNIQKAISYIIAIHIPIVGLSLIPFAMGMPPILWPVHIAFLELIIDPVCSIAFEAEPAEASIMKRAPRSLRSRLFSRAVLSAGLVQGIAVLAAIFVLYGTMGKWGESSDHSRAIAFATLMFANIALILTLRSRTEPAWMFLQRRNPTFAWIGLALFVAGALVLYLPGMESIFRFKPLTVTELLMCAGIPVLSLVGFEIAKLRHRY